MGKKRKRIIFMGTSPFGAEMLKALVSQEFLVVAVITKPNRPVGRGHKLKEPEVKKFAKQQGIPVYQPEKLDEEIIQEIKKLEPELMIVAAYGKIIPPKLLDIPLRGTINVHPSLLPKFRGPSPVQNALLLGEKEIGITIMLLDEGMDSGAILAQEILKIKEKETISELMQRITPKAADLLIRAIPFWLSGKIIPQKQDNSQATYCRIIKKTDGKIDWSGSARNIANAARAFEIWPGLYAFWENPPGVLRRVNFKKVSWEGEAPPENFKIGEVFLKDKQLKIQTGAGQLIVEKIQMEGGRVLDSKEFLNGQKRFIGSVLK